LGTDVGLLSAPADLNRYTINDPALWELTNVGNGLPNNQILELKVIENRLWVGTAAGLANIDAAGSVRVETAWGTTSADAAHSLIVSDGKILVANTTPTKQYRYYHYEPGSGKTPVGIFGSPIVRFINDSNGDLWIGLNRNGLYHPGRKNFCVWMGPAKMPFATSSKIRIRIYGPVPVNLS
jgi:ligand-binding sensor domain-containing protein